MLHCVRLRCACDTVRYSTAVCHCSRLVWCAHVHGALEKYLTNQPGWRGLPAVQQGRVYAVDGNAYCNRPGPRIVDSLEILAALIHPDISLVSRCRTNSRSIVSSPHRRLISRHKKDTMSPHTTMIIYQDVVLECQHCYRICRLVDASVRRSCPSCGLDIANWDDLVGTLHNDTNV